MYSVSHPLPNLSLRRRTLRTIDRHLRVPLHVQAEPAVVGVVVAGDARVERQHPTGNRTDPGQAQRGRTEGHPRDHRIGIRTGVAALVAPPVPPAVDGGRRRGVGSRTG